MQRLLLNSLAVATLLCHALVTPRLASAAPPSGEYEYAFDSADDPALWDFSGVYPPPLWATLDLGAKGRITGSGEMKGKVSGGAGNVRVSLKERVPGWGESGNGLDGILLKRNCKYALTLEPVARVLGGMQTCVDKRFRVDLIRGARPLNTTQMRAPISVPLLDTANPEWQLALDVVPDGKKLSGSARITLASGKIIAFALRGKYAEKTGRSKIVLKGLEEDRGERLSLQVDGSEMALSQMRGKVAGQKIRWLDAAD